MREREGPAPQAWESEGWLAGTQDRQSTLAPAPLGRAIRPVFEDDPFCQKDGTNGISISKAPLRARTRPLLDALFDVCHKTI